MASCLICSRCTRNRGDPKRGHGSCDQEWNLDTEVGNGTGPDNEVKIWLSRKAGLRNQEGRARKFGCFMSRILRHPIW